MRRLNFVTIVLMAVVFCSNTWNGNSVWAGETTERKTDDSRKEQSRLFQEFKQATANNQRATLPDFSYAGYHWCEKPLPVVSEEQYKYFDVTDFGAVPDDGKSDRNAALAAFAAAHQHDGKAVIYFPAGNFRLFEKSDFGKAPLEIKRSNIVLKGSGVATTQLEFAETHLPVRALIYLRSSSGKQDYFRGDQRFRAKLKRQIDPFTIQLDDAKEFSPGMRVNLNPQLDIKSEGAENLYQPYGILDGVARRAASRNGMLTDTFELHTVKEVSEDRVTFVEPVHLDLDQYQSCPIFRVDNGIEECGIEDLSFRGGWQGQFKHHNGTRYGEDFRMIEMNRVFNSWVRRVRFTNCSAALTTWMTGFNTVRDLLIEGNTGHFSVVSYASYGNLFAFMREQEETLHGFGVARSACGTVFYRCSQFDSLEAHGGYARSTLFDLNEGGFIPRGGGAAHFPFHDRGLVFWNWNVTRPGQSYDFWQAGKRYGYILFPVIAGLHGEPFKVIDADTDLAAFESPGKKADPASLFEAQLAVRLGETPRWLKADAAAFESISRHSKIEIVSPKPNSHRRRSIAVRMKLPRELDLDAVAKVELLASRTGLFEGYQRVGDVNPKSLRINFSPKRSGVWALQAKLTNTRGEISHSRPVVVHLGSSKTGDPIPVVRSAVLPAKSKSALYREFLNLGGGEGRKLKDSKILPPGFNNIPELEVAYRKELHKFYSKFGRTAFRDALAKHSAASLFDGDLKKSGGPLLYGDDTLVQAKFAKLTRVNRVDIHWKPSQATSSRSLRLEIQTSKDRNAWFSVVNDDRLWKSSAGRVGETRAHASLPISDSVSTIYFPEQKAKYIRLLMTRFPRIAEIRFYGE